MNSSSKHSNKQFSFEFSAPRDSAAIERVKKVHARLNQLSPEFFSVTYGAGGSTRDGTQQAVIELNRLGTPVAAHISFGTDGPEAIGQLINDYRDAGVTRLVALRGDLPSGISQASLTHANDLVAFIRKTTGDHFHIDVAAYPEFHPETERVEDEIRYFKMKVEAGANSAITQYFYNAEAYFNFMELCAAAGITLPIYPGIMPITNYEGLMRFSRNCGADIPRWIEQTLHSYQDDTKSLQAFGEEVVSRLCEQLLDWGAPGLHFYTLNRADPSLRICHNLGLSRQ